MNSIDWSIVVVYLAGMIGLSIYLGRGQATSDDYYVGGRKISWIAIGFSTMATQTSAISFISIPAFVALKDGGGLTWLQYELALPIAVILVMAFLIPFFRHLKLVSVYEYLELRFNASVRSLASLVFLISRGLATGVGVYASAIVLSVCLEIPIWTTILIIGVVTVVYDTIGGISAVVYSDLIQMMILIAGVITCILFAASEVGGFDVILSSLPAARQKALDLSTGLSGGSTVPFWAFLFGGFFLYASYYGTDQSQVQRELSSKSTDETKKSLLLNGLARFPLTILYLLLGMAVFSVYQRSPELQSAVPHDRPDYLVPQFVLLNLPTGIRALLFSSLLAAAMSSLDSALNSLSASTMKDFVSKYLKSSYNPLQLSKIITVVWGVFITGFAFLVGGISDTVIESINKIGSAFYGPVLAAFLIGVLSKSVNSFGMIFGILAGVVLNLILWLAFPGIHWMWWNVFGCLTAIAVAWLSTRFTAPPNQLTIAQYTLWQQDIYEREKSWRLRYGMLGGYFLLILTVIIWIGG
ncbi:sodium/solute symporter [bacterium]|nr:sodium/solute symporter [bacterium]